MNFVGRLSPIRAIRDLRFFLAQRRPYELGILALSMLVTAGLVTAFAYDSREEPVYRRNIIYVEQWPVTRTKAEIVAQQTIDEAARAKRKAEIERQEKELQAQYKRLDDRLKAMGL
jgi:hypothetical protein